MHDDWAETTASQIVEPWASRLADLGFDIDAFSALSVLMASPDTAESLRVEGEDGEEGLRSFVPGTRVFFLKSKASDIGWDATIAGSIYATTGSASLASAVTIFKRAVQTFRLLSAEEMDVILVMRGLCGTRDREFTTITPTELAAVYAGTGTNLEALTASLVDKGAVHRVEDGWRLVP